MSLMCVFVCVCTCSKTIIFPAGQFPAHSRGKWTGARQIAQTRQRTEWIWRHLIKKWNYSIHIHIGSRAIRRAAAANPFCTSRSIWGPFQALGALQLCITLSVCWLMHPRTHSTITIHTAQSFGVQAVIANYSRLRRFFPLKSTHFPFFIICAWPGYCRGTLRFITAHRAVIHFTLFHIQTNFRSAVVLILIYP